MTPKLDDVALLDGAVEHLLVSGGDCRMDLDPRTGLNKYGCTPWPRSAVPFGSCTSSSPSDYAIEAAKQIQRRLRAAASQGEVQAFAHEQLELLRKELAGWLRADRVAGTRIAFTPSGTDTELLASVLALGDGTRSLCNIISGPSEVGSGTMLAAGGRHFNRLTPHGGVVQEGVPLAGGLSDQVRIETIVLRDAQGERRPPEDLDAEAEDLVEQAMARGERVLLHVVAHSKTGTHAPTLDAVARLRARHGEDVSVLIDGAQGRFSRRGLTAALEKGYMFLFTGSKFYGGPPFSGALIVPASMGPEARCVTALPEGARDYFTAGELPTEWTALRASLRGAANLGLLLRWSAAMAELRAYYAADGNSRYRILRAFEAAVPELLGASPCIDLEEVHPPILDDSVGRLLESKVTVFSFFLHPAGDPDATFDKAALARVFRWLNTPVSHMLAGVTERDAAMLRQCFHLGQPVQLGGGRALLRVALGGPLIVRVANDSRVGEDLEERLGWLRRQLVRLRRKLELLIEHYDRLVEIEGP